MPERRTESRRAARVIDRLEAAMPGARIELDFGTDLELLVAVILSAQARDARVNLATPGLFAAFPDAAAYAAADPEDLWPHVRSLGLFRNKAKAIVAASRAIQERHAGRVPRTREALEALPGVGRKTAGVVLVHLGAGHAFPVDTHVGRLARRLGFSTAIDPDRVEEDLSALLPPERWGKAHQLLVWHGRRTCHARKPDCAGCVVARLCPSSTGPSGAGRPSSPRRASRRRARP
jgi:endonuclease-3